MEIKKIKIGGHYLDIIQSESIQAGGVGTCCTSSNLIWIDSGLKSSKKVSTLIHEILHEINWQLTNNELSEIQIAILGEALFQVLIDNPELLMEINYINSKKLEEKWLTFLNFFMNCLGFI